ncbi:Dbl homology domain-containing protein [Boletus coccyginus]|nr:Dbl homology domain-containing protein [Boletus coccyginus]
MSNSSTRRSSRGTAVPDSPPARPTVRDQQWQTLESHILGSYGEVEARRQRFVWEFTESEDSFVTQLQNMIQLFILPLRVRDTRMWVSGIPSDVTKLFDWLDDIVRVHAQLSSTLASRQIIDHPRLQIISEVFRGFVPRLETYQPYLVKLEFTASVIDSFVHEGKNDFGDFIKLQEASERCQGWSLEKYLIEPVNRLAQYPEVFRASIDQPLFQFTDLFRAEAVAVDTKVSP